MIKYVTIFSFLLLSFSLHAQTERTDSICRDSVQAKIKQSAFKKAIGKFFNFSNFDTLYISPNRYNYALMATHFSNFEYYSIRSSSPKTQQLSFALNPHHKIGFYFGWRWIFLGWSFDIGKFYNKNEQSKNGTTFELSLYSSKIGLDVFYRRTGNNYKVYKVSGFSDNLPSNYSASFNGLDINMKGLNLYYIFNNRKFSYPAAFSQSTNQRRSTGSLIAGLSLAKNNLNFDYTKLPLILQETMNPGMKVEKIQYSNIALTCGYAYNWVFARNFLACLSLTPVIAYKTSHIQTVENQENERYCNINLDFIMRAGLVYNNSKYFIGTSFVGQTYDYYRKNFSLSNGFGTLQVYAGFNFYLKKEHRKKK